MGPAGGRRRLLRGLVSLLVIRSLIGEEKYGYEIRRELAEVLGEELPPGYIYVILKDLRRRGLLESRDSVSGRGRRVVAYRATGEGLRFLLGHKHALEVGRRAIGELERAIGELESGSRRGQAGGGRRGSG